MTDRDACGDARSLHRERDALVAARAGRDEALARPPARPHELGRGQGADRPAPPADGPTVAR